MTVKLDGVVTIEEQNVTNKLKGVVTFEEKNMDEGKENDRVQENG